MGTHHLLRLLCQERLEKLAPWLVRRYGDVVATVQTPAVLDELRTLVRSRAQGILGMVATH